MYNSVSCQIRTMCTTNPVQVVLVLKAEAGKKPLDEWLIEPYAVAVAHLEGKALKQNKNEEVVIDLTGPARESYIKGKAIYNRDGHCGTCHQPDGAGLPASGFPGLNGNQWVQGSEDRLIKIILKGLYGPLELKGVKYPGHVPMTPFGGLLKDEEVAAVATYIRNSFGNKAAVVSPEKVKSIRDEIKDKKGFYSPEELLKEYPIER